LPDNLTHIGDVVKVNLLIKNGIVVAVDKEFRIYQDGAVVIEGNQIVDVGKTSRIEQKYTKKDYTVIDAKNKAVIPGFVNTHAHLYQNFMKGWHDNLQLKEWIYYVLFPIVQYANSLPESEKTEFFRTALTLANIEALKTGTTTLVDFSTTADISLDVFESTGIRGVGGMTLADRWIPEELIKPVDEILNNIRKLTKLWHNKHNGLIKFMLAPSTPYIASKDLLIESKKLADEFNLPYTIHVAESPYEVEMAKEETGKTPIKYLYDIGVLDRRVITVHNIWLTEEEINLLAKSGASVSHNPKSNMRLASGIMQTRKFMDLGINVSIGTDGAASNDTLDMLDAARAAVLLSKVFTKDATSLTGVDGLKMATINGARALLMEHEVGSIEVGKKADIVLIDLDQVHLRPITDIVNVILYAGYGHDVDTVIVDGKVIVENKKVKTVDEEKVLTLAKEKYEPILQEIYEQTKRDIKNEKNRATFKK